MSYYYISFLCFFLSLSFCTVTPCRNKPLLFNFGDSNSDTGGLSVLMGLPLELPAGRTFFHEPTDRLCDGRLIIDFLCESLPTKFLTPYLELYAPDFSNGVNFALSGSDTLRTNVPYTLSTQISQFSRFRNVSISRGFIDENQLKSALFMLDIGQNDIQGNFQLRTFDQVLTLIPDVINNIKNAMKTIYELGGRNFWVHNTGPGGCMPSNILLINASTVVDEYGCLSDRNKAAAKFNSDLKSLCQKMQAEMTDAKIIYVDIFSIKLDLIVNATSYGFEDPFTACRGESLCPEGSRYVSWDGTHYTEAANMLVASKILSTAFSTPPYHFSFFCEE